MSLNEHVGRAIIAEQERTKAILAHGRATGASDTLIVAAIADGISFMDFEVEVLAMQIAAA